MDPPSNQERFLALLQPHQRALLKVCWAYGRTPHDRDDLWQEILGRLWAAFGSYDPDRKFSTWMFRVALNVAIDYRRRQLRWRRNAASLDQEAEVADAAANDSTKRELLSDLRELLEGVNEADRAILVLYLESHSYREISEIVGTSESNVGTRLHRLKTSLRKSNSSQEQET